MPTLQAAIEKLKGDQKFMTAPPEKQTGYLRDVILPAVDASFSKGTPERQNQYINEIVLPKLKLQPLSIDPPQVEPMMNLQQTPPPPAMPAPDLPDVSIGQGLQNIGNTAMSGIGGFVQNLGSPDFWGQMGNDIGNAFQTEAQSLTDPSMPLMDRAILSTPVGRFVPGIYKGAQGLAQGVSSLPADIGNAYYGQEVFDPLVQFPELSGYLQEFSERFPVSTFAGEQVPYSIPVGRAAQAGKIQEFLRAAGEGAAIGGVMDPRGGGLEGRAANATFGATAPVVLGGGASLVGRVGKSVKVGEVPNGIRSSFQGQERPVGLRGMSPRKVSAGRKRPIRTQQDPSSLPYGADFMQVSPEVRMDAEGRIVDRSLERQETLSPSLDRNRSGVERLRAIVEEGKQRKAEASIPSQTEKFQKRYGQGKQPQPVKRESRPLTREEMITAIEAKLGRNEVTSSLEYPVEYGRSERLSKSETANTTTINRLRQKLNQKKQQKIQEAIPSQVEKFKERYGKPKPETKPVAERPKIDQGSLVEIFGEEIAAEIKRLDNEVKRLEDSYKQRVQDNPNSIEAEKNKAFKTLYGKGAKTQGREIHIIMGPPGAGKSSVVAKRLLKEKGAIEIDSDAAKPFFKEFNDGIGAGAVHEPSGEVTARILSKAIENGDNIVYPIVGKNLKKVRAEIAEYKGEGYKVFLYNVDIPPAESARRAWTRYQESGRYVSPIYTNSIGFKPKENFDILIKEGNLDGFQEYSNNVKFGEKPKLLRDGPGQVRKVSDLPTGRELRSGSGRDGGGYRSGGTEENKEIPRKLLTGKPHEVVTPEGTRAKVRFTVLEQKDLITSHDERFNINPDYPAELQPRDRERSASEAQVDDIARKLDPEQLGYSVKAGDGAPIIGADRVVESGNGRTMAIRKAYANHPEKAKAYKEFLLARAEEFGLKPEDIKGMKEPVLARIREGEIDRKKFAQEANFRDTATMSPAEQARQDADRMGEDLLEIFNPDEDGLVTNAGNRNFLKGFVDKVVGSNDRGAMVTREGDLSLDGINRIKRAIFAKAYANKPEGMTVLETLFESSSNKLKNLGTAMLNVAGDMVRLKSAIAKGERYSLDISNDLTAVVGKIRKLRESGIKTADYLPQQSLLDDITPFQKQILSDLEANKRSAKKLTNVLREYLQRADQEGDPRQGSLLATAKKTKEQIWKEAVENAEDGPQGQGSLFKSASEKQAEQAQAIKKQRRKKDEGGFMRIGGSVRKTASKAFDTGKSGVEDLIGPTRKEPSVIAQMKEGMKNLFVYMSEVKDKTFVIDGKKVPGNKFIAQVDRLRTQLTKGYSRAEEKIRNALEVLEDEPGYSARDKVRDATQYLLYTDYYRRMKDGFPVPGDLKLVDLIKGIRATEKHIRGNPDVRKAVLNVRNLLNEIGDDLVKAGIIEKKRKQYFPHQILEQLRDLYGLPTFKELNGITGNPKPKKVEKQFRGYAQRLKGSIMEIDTDLISVLNTHMKAINRHNAIDGFVDEVIKVWAHPSWKQGDPLPDGFAEFQPRSGNQHFLAYSVKEKAIAQAVYEKLMGDPDPAVQASLSEIKQIFAVGKKKITYAIPKEIDAYLRNIYEPRFLEGDINLVKKAVQAWKAIVTASPLNPGVIAFHFRNTIGDVENALRDDPNLMKYVRRAIGEMEEANRGKPSKLFLSAEEWGTIGAGYYGSEMQLADDFHFKRRFSKSTKDRILTRTPILSRSYKTYKDAERMIVKLGEAREDVLRYAKFLRDTDLGLKPWQAHIENGKTFVNYAHLTRFERDVLRDTLLPFYTFYKSNAVNWFSAITGKRALTTAARAAGLAFVFPFATAVWNQMVDPQLEDMIQYRKSKRSMANVPHIITPFKDHNGNKIIILLPSSSNAALQLAGLAKAPYRVAKTLDLVLNGRVSMTEAIRDQITRSLQEDITIGIGKDDEIQVPRPIGEAVELLSPFIKEPMEQLFDYDLFRGRQITREGDNVPEGENFQRRFSHLLGVAAPPFTRLAKLTNENMDKRLAVLDLLVGVVKAPDVYSWSDLKDEERKFEREQKRIKDPRLLAFREKVNQSLYDELSHVVYDARFLGERKLRYGEYLTVDKRKRVSELLRSSTQGNKASYSATSKEGLLKLVKILDQAYQNPRLSAGQKAKLKLLENALPKYLELLNNMSEKRIQAAISAVKGSPNPKEQGKIFKYLTSTLEDPPEIKKRIDDALLDGGIQYTKEQKKISRQ